jgi:PleD family two-component response regulator
LSRIPASDSASSAAASVRPRRALVVADAAGLSLQQQLTASGYITQSALVADASRTINEFKPDIVIMIAASANTEAEYEEIALMRKLRAETTTYSLPIVFAWTEDERSLRAAAQYNGADDYFASTLPRAEILARLDSLFWRIEADRRSVPIVSDRRMEIDNFMFMLDAVREDVRAELNGTLALIYAASARSKQEALDKAVRDRTLVEVHNFLKLNLRRVDAVAYYGPTTLLVYLPRMDARSAVAALTRLHKEFQAEQPTRNFVAGVASFPAHDTEVENLIEKAEEAVNRVRKVAGEQHIIAYEVKADATAPAVVSEVRDEPATSSEVRAPISPINPVAPPSPRPNVEIAIEQKREVAPEVSATVAANVQSTTSESREDGAHQTRLNNETRPNDGAQYGSESAARELERRASGAVMPRRLLLTVSDAVRMTQINSLIRSAGYEARAAFNGQQALDLLRIERPDLLLIDYELQGIDGLETIRRLRKRSGGRLALPVVMILSTENERARREALELGARSVLTTPYEPAELLASLRQAGNVD